MASPLNDATVTCIGWSRRHFYRCGALRRDEDLAGQGTQYAWRAGPGVLEACRLVAERAGTTLQALLPTVSRFGLGTTAVTNTIASRTGRRAGLVTTSGFEDLVPGCHVGGGTATGHQGVRAHPVHAA